MSMISQYATENYLKAIVKALADPERDRLGTGELARLLGVTAGTATVMVKKLQKEGHLEYESHKGCALTRKGLAYGLRVIRRHRILETFLHDILGLGWEEMHEEAENLEHAASDKLIDRLDAYLGHPERDPHGDPIPKANQASYSLIDKPLSSAAEGSRATILRIDGDMDALNYYRKAGLLPGTAVHIVKRDAAAGLAVVTVDGAEQTLALSALEGIFI